jgi:UPF0716 protein FxsA
LGRALFLVFLLVPLVEIAFFVLIGQAIGLWLTLLGVLVTAVLGSLVLRVQGLSLINEIRATVGRGQLPARAIADAMMVGVAGLVLLLPGYFSDLIGILLLVPAVRMAIYTFLKSRFVLVSAATAGAAAGAHRDGRVEDGGTIDLDQDDWRHR